MNERRDWTALIITVCAVVTAMPRWIGALLASEGFAVPEEWRPWWIVASTVFNAAMAVTEGVAFAYVFNAWRNQKDKSSDKLLWLALASGVVFVIVLAPFIAAQTRASETPLAGMLANDYALWLWSAAVAASTIVIVASVGYAQKRTSAPPIRTVPALAIAEKPLAVPIVQIEPTQSVHKCERCEREFATVQALSAHQRFCTGKVSNGNGIEAAIELTNGAH